jgi:hypothetical protein
MSPRLRDWVSASRGCLLEAVSPARAVGALATDWTSPASPPCLAWRATTLACARRTAGCAPADARARATPRSQVSTHPEQPLDEYLPAQQTPHHRSTASSPDPGGLMERFNQVPGPRHSDLAEAQRDIDNLHAALTSQPVIEQAKGILMARHGCGPDRSLPAARGGLPAGAPEASRPRCRSGPLGPGDTKRPAAGPAGARVASRGRPPPAKRVRPPDAS